MMTIKKISALFNARSERERLVIVFFLLITVSCIWFFLLCLPIAIKINSNSKEINRIQKNISDLTILYKKDEEIIHSPTSTLEEKKLSLEKSLESIKKDGLLTKRMVDTENDYRTVMQDISQLPDSLSLNQIQDLAETDSTGNKKVSIEFSGGYFETIAYLDYLENLPWYLSFDRVDYTVEDYPNAKVIVVITLLRMPAGFRHD